MNNYRGLEDYPLTLKQSQAFAKKIVATYNKRIKLEKVFTEISAGLNWENWCDDDTGKEWTVPQVLYCKIDQLRDKLHGLTKEDLAEEMDTLNYLQKVVERL